MKLQIDRVLIVGLDGASFALLDALGARGLTPRLTALRRRSAWGVLLSTVPPFTVPAWSSMMTGKGPGKHGVISFFQYSLSEYHCQSRGTFVNGLSVAGETLWGALSREDRHVVVINVPMTYPPRPVNGCLITGMLTPYGAKNFTHPEELAGDLGDYQIDLQYARRGNRIDPDAYPKGTRLIEEIQAMTRRRAEASLWLMRQRPWDLFTVVFTGTDRVCHFFWPELMYPGSGQREIVAATEAYYRGLDEAVGQLLDEAGPRTLVLVMSDHGFGPAPSHRFYPNLWLEGEGWLRRRVSSPEAGLRGRLVRWLHARPRLRRFLKDVLPPRLRERARDIGCEDVRGTVDWSRTEAYFVPMSNNVCGIAVNQAGVKRCGVVPPQDVEDLRLQIGGAAKRLLNPATGERMVLRAQAREELYSGPYVDTFPEVILTLDPDFACSTSLRGTSQVEHITVPRRPGEHRREGILIAAGPPILTGKLAQPAHIEDIMPTTLYFMGLAVPGDVDGRVLKSMTRTEYLEKRPVRFRKAMHTGRAGGSDVGAEDQAAVEDRLRALGYL